MKGRRGIEEEEEKGGAVFTDRRGGGKPGGGGRLMMKWQKSTRKCRIDEYVSDRAEFVLDYG